jgi:ABC-type tungstate transport system permease subunit
MLALLALTAAAQSPAPTRPDADLILCTTTSTEDSGVLDTLVPAFVPDAGTSEASLGLSGSPH